MIQYVKAGRLGKKTGKGVYEYTGVKEMKLQNVQFETVDRIAHVTINRPDVRNALDFQTVQELHSVLVSDKSEKSAQ